MFSTEPDISQFRNAFIRNVPFLLPFLLLAGDRGSGDRGGGSGGVAASGRTSGVVCCGESGVAGGDFRCIAEGEQPVARAVKGYAFPRTVADGSAKHAT